MDKNYPDRYIFPAIFDYADDGITIDFPDLPGCMPCAHTDEEALHNAKEALALHLWGMERDNDIIPKPSRVQDIKTEPNQTVMLIDVWMPPFRHKMQNKSVNKTVTLPLWLDDLAKEHDINFSHLLQDAIKKQLGINEKRSS